MTPITDMEQFFATFRHNIIGQQQTFDSPFGTKRLLYADWTATGRAYQPIEDYIQTQILPFLANTHTATTLTGRLMSQAYEEAKQIVKDHVHATNDDVLIFCGSGMTSAVNKLQRLLGLRIPERLMDYMKKEDSQAAISEYLPLDEALKPVVFVTHMEHHSNQTTWLETIATVEIIPPDSDGHVDMAYLKNLLEHYKHRKYKIAAITACSNVTGIQTPYHEIAQLMHAHDGLCFVDFACSAPYVDINMHPAQAGAHLDAIYFSPHKFLGGPGTPGILIFNKKIYKNRVPDQPGGGTLTYSNPWKFHKYVSLIEQREDGGTPPIVQGIKVAMCVRLKEVMGAEKMQKREQELLQILFARLAAIPQVHLLAGQCTNRLGVLSFRIHGAHYPLIVKLLNDRFGIQTRGGCSCAGTYGHFLLAIDERRSKTLLDSIHAGDLLSKPGWIRLSIHPTMTTAEINFILDSIEETACHYQDWQNDYVYDPESNEYSFKGGIEPTAQNQIEEWFKVSNWD